MRSYIQLPSDDWQRSRDKFTRLIGPYFLIIPLREIGEFGPLVLRLVPSIEENRKIGVRYKFLVLVEIKLG